MQTTEEEIKSVVQAVLAQMTNPGSNGSSAPASNNGHENWGVFNSVDDAVAAAHAGYLQLREASMEDRGKAIELVKSICEEQATELGTLEFEETKVGRLDHKIEKLYAIRKVPGIEALRSDAVSGDYGLTVTEYAPFGVIGAITPVTHSLPTLACNFVNMVAAGNTIVCNPHPSGAKIACEGVRRFNKAIFEATGLRNLITIIETPTLESADAIFKHRSVRVLVVTGGPAVARAAMQSSKKAIVAGPGNPPVVVDETADLDNAARCIIIGASYDNNLLCIGEKEVFAVEPIFDKLMNAMSKNGAYRLNAQQTEQLTRLAFSPPKEPGGHAMLNRDFIGKDASYLAKQVGLSVPVGTELLFGETDVNNPFVPEEQMMPFVPFVRAKNFEHAVDLAMDAEHGFGHTAIIHSQKVRNMTYMGKMMDTTLFVKNGASVAALGTGGEGFLSFSIATPTGEGVTSPLTFTRQRRCTLADDLRII